MLLFFLSLSQYIFSSEKELNYREQVIYPLIKQFYKDFQTGLEALAFAKKKESTTQTRKNINHIKSVLVATPACWQRSIIIADSSILSQAIEQANQLKIALLIEAFCASKNQQTNDQTNCLFCPLEDLTYLETPSNSSVANSSVHNDSIGNNSAVCSIESCIKNNSSSVRRPSKWAELREDIKFFKKKIPRSAFDDLKSDESDPEDF